MNSLNLEIAKARFLDELVNVQEIDGINLLLVKWVDLTRDTLANLADIFREKHPENAICGIVSPGDAEITTMVTVSKDLIKQGIKAGELVGKLSQTLGGGGGGAPHLAFGGGKDSTRIEEAFSSLKTWIIQKHQTD